MTNWASPSADPNPKDPQPQPQYGQYASQGTGPTPSQGGAGTPPAPGYGYAPMPAQFTPKPGVIPLRPLVLGDIFEGAFRTVRGNPSATIGLAFAVSLLFAIPTVLITLLIANTPFGTDALGESSYVIASYGGQAVSVVASILLSGMLIAVVAEAVLGHRASIGEAWTKIKPRIWALLGATALIALATIVLVGLIVGLVALVYVGAGQVPAIIVGFVAAAAGFAALIWFTTKTTFATASIMLEKLGPIAGIKRSFALTKGQFWRILGISLLAQLLAGTIASILLVPAMLIGMGVLLASGDLNQPDQIPVGFLIFMQIVTVISSAITAPFTASVTGLLYIDQRIRREALDLNLMTAAGLK